MQLGHMMWFAHFFEPKTPSNIILIFFERFKFILTWTDSEQVPSTEHRKNRACEKIKEIVCDQTLELI